MGRQNPNVDWDSERCLPNDKQGFKKLENLARYKQ